MIILYHKETKEKIYVRHPIDVKDILSQGEYVEAQPIEEQEPEPEKVVAA